MSNISHYSLYNEEPGAEEFRKKMASVNATYDRCICKLDEIEAILKRSSANCHIKG